MADLERLNAPPVPPQQIEQRERARLKVAEHASRRSPSRIGQREWCGIYLDMLALWPAQDSEHVPTTMSRGRLTNSTMIQTSDARRRLEMQRRENLKEAIAKRERKGVGHAK